MNNQLMDNNRLVNNLKIYYQNCRGIRTKLQTLYMNILANSYDIIVLTETWLIAEIDNNEFIDQRYTVYRCDRDRVVTNRQDGGGVLVAVLRGLRSNIYDTSTLSNYLSPACIEHLLVEIPCVNRNKKYIISAAYIPPRTPADVYENHFDLLQDSLNYSLVDNFYIIGDYNIPDIDWISTAPGTYIHGQPSGLISVGSSCTHSVLANFMSSVNASQYNAIVNAKGKILDIVISNSPTTVYLQNNPFLPLDPYHPPFIVDVNAQHIMHAMKRRPPTKYNFYKADFDLINNKLEETDWTDLLQNLPSETAVDTFYNTIDNIIKQHTPLAGSRTSGFPVWFSRSLIRTFKNKHKAWTKWKKFKNESDYDVFSHYRAIFKKNCELCYHKYMESVEDNISKNIKHFWTYMSNRKAKPEIPSTMQYKNNKSSDPVGICNLFSDFFLSVFEPSSTSLSQWQPPPPTFSENSTYLTNLQFSESSILKELKLLDTSKGPGPDSLPPIFFKQTANNICVPLYIIYNKCVLEGVFPEIWKRANITPVHKSGSRHDVEQYRPISILSVLSKLFERLVHNEIYPILHNSIIDEQHGFVKRRSTSSNLLIFTNFLFQNLDNRVQVDAVYTDFKKAFDKIDHELLLNKIAFNGIHGNLLRWFVSYIQNRSQKVVINGFQSRSIVATSGVPQGSILGPLLFIMFINDIKKCFNNSNFLLYADDLKIYKTIKSIEDSICLQQDLDRFMTYCHTNKLQLSVPKCNYINYTKNKNIIKHTYNLGNAFLSKVTALRDLGIQLDTKLCLNLHVDNIVNKAFKMYGFVMRSSSDFKRTSTYLYLYKSLVRSQLEYAVPIWNPLYNKYVEAIERVQKKFLRAMNYRCNKTYLSYPQLLTRFNMTTLESRRKYLSATTLYKIVSNMFDCIDLVRCICYVVPRTVHKRQARAGRFFAVASCRTNAGLRVPIRRMADIYNDNFIEIDIFTCNEHQFKLAVLQKIFQ